jgi:hypothetical protein
VNRNLYVITPIFNPFNFKSRYRLYRHFERHMAESGVKLLTIEAAFGDQPFGVTTADNPWNLQLRTNQILWHKERLINLAAKYLAQIEPNFRYLGWFDSDITFANPDWVAEALHQLSHLSVIQPFSTAINLDAHEDPMWNCPSSFRSFVEGRGFHQEPPLPVTYTYKGHPGLAWCATRAAFEGLGGLEDHGVAGSGDTLMSNALKGSWDVFLGAPPTPGQRAKFDAWQKRADAVVRGQIGFSRGAVLHHWHGHSEARGYEKRAEILAFHQYDPATDLVEDSQGLYRWAGNKPRLEDDIRLSLGSRNEDAI